jgi:hypothetical protein
MFILEYLYIIVKGNAVAATCMCALGGYQTISARARSLSRICSVAFYLLSLSRVEVPPKRDTRRDRIVYQEKSVEKPENSNQCKESLWRVVKLSHILDLGKPVSK